MTYLHSRTYLTPLVPTSSFLPVSCDPLSLVLPQRLQQNRRVRPNHLVNLAAVLVEEKGGHGADAQLLAQLGQLIHVKLDKVDLVLELCILRGPLLDS